ncbi:unnamed protein product [Urochloa humidicola]
MEEFQEAEILWPSSNDHHDNNNDVVDKTGSTTAAPSARSKPPVSPPAMSAPVEISRRKRRCRPWAAPEHTKFNQETGGSDGEEDDY